MPNSMRYQTLITIMQVYAINVRFFSTEIQLLFEKFAKQTEVTLPKLSNFMESRCFFLSGVSLLSVNANHSLDIAVIWWWCIWIVIIIVYCLWISGRKYETNSSDNMNKMSFIFPLRSIGLEFWNIYNIHCTTLYKKPCLRNWEI